MRSSTAAWGRGTVCSRLALVCSPDSDQRPFSRSRSDQRIRATSPSRWAVSINNRINGSERPAEPVAAVPHLVQLGIGQHPVALALGAGGLHAGGRRGGDQVAFDAPVEHPLDVGEEQVGRPRLAAIEHPVEHAQHVRLGDAAQRAVVPGLQVVSQDLLGALPAAVARLLIAQDEAGDHVVDRAVAGEPVRVDLGRLLELARDCASAPAPAPGPRPATWSPGRRS